MKIIGITGPIGCGKSYVSKLIEKRGIPSIDADEVYHSLTNKYSLTVQKLENEFGDGILTSEKTLDRKKLAAIVFSDESKLERLNEITHSAVTEEIERRLSEYKCIGTDAVLVQVPLMFESGFDKNCDFVICVVADEEIRIKRICVRDNISVQNAKNRIKNQKDIQFYIANSSETVYNNGVEDLNAQIDRIWDKLELGEKK